MFASTFPQYSIGILGPILIVDARISEMILGFSVGAMYIVAALIARFSGSQLDRLSGRASYLLLGVTAVAGLLSLAAVKNVAILLLACLFAGATVGTNNPVTNRLILFLVPHGRRGIVIGIKQTGVKVAQIVTGALIPLLTVLFGWRLGIVLLSAALAAVLLLGLWLIPRERATGESESAEGVRSSAKHDLRWLQIYLLLMAAGMSAVITYLPLYSVNALQTSLTTAGLFVTAFATAATFTRVIWVVIAERFSDAVTLLIVQSVGGVVALAGFASAVTVGSWLMWPAAVLGGATVGSTNVLAQLVVINRVSADHVAAVSGSVQSGYLVGLAIGAPVMGVIFQTTGSFVSGWIFTAALTGAGTVIAHRSRRFGSSSITTRTN